jgi:acetyl-CoA carboxylase beta subunit
VSSLDARALRDLVLDPGSWKSWDSPVTVGDVPESYAAELARAAERTRQDESITSGEGQLRGRRVAVIAGEFGFLAGSIGVAAADRLIAAVERATEEGLPLLAAPVSGGTRMQEGTVAFLQMIGITAAIARHKEAGLPYLVYLRHPTFGGVLASWGSLGHVTIAEPGASIGFLGPRVYEALYGEPFPEGVQTAEHLAEHGLIDAVVPHEEIAEVADRALRVLAARQTWHRDVADAERPTAGGRHRLPPRGPARCAAAAADGGHRRRRPVRHRRRGEGPRAAAGPGALRRGAVRRPRSGPARAVAVGAAGAGRAA